MQRDGGPGGAGGAGNPTGGAFTGPGQALELVGDHCYAYNTATITTTPTVIMQFTTGNYYAITDISLYAGVSFASTGNLVSGAISGLKVSLNDSIIGFIKSDSEHEDMPFPSIFKVLIPSYTVVELEVMSATTSADYLLAVGITGRIYRG